MKMSMLKKQVPEKEIKELIASNMCHEIIKENYQEGDEVWWWSDLGFLSGGAGHAILRNGNLVVASLEVIS